MNKTELTIVVALFAVLLSWGFFQRSFTPRPLPEPAVTQAETSSSSPEVTQQGTDLSVGAKAVAPDTAIERHKDSAPETPAADVTRSEQELEPESSLPEQTCVLANEQVYVTLSSRGATVKEVELVEYPETQEEESGSVRLDFSSHSALAISGIAGLSTGSDFELTPGPDSSSALLTRAAPGGFRFERRIQLEENYRLVVVDTMINEGESTVAVPRYGVSVGPMRAISSKAKTRGIAYLGIDTLASHGGKKVDHWGRKRLPALFGQRTAPFSCARPDTSAMPDDVSHPIDQPLSWLAAKNKFFVQILAPEGESVAGELSAARDPESKDFAITTVWGSMIFQEKALLPGESTARTMSYFVGPKKYTLLKKLGGHQDEVMEFGWFSWMCKPLLVILNKIHAVVKNYGMAIILLTALVRIIFWPVTHKSTESMKKMQKLQPLVTEIREKYKSNPQKMNQEVMALYKEHKANPMAGCLPMVIQIPVFIALFTVLRSAVELRFAGFLWIGDLSEPENLFAGMIPIVGSLNILPLVMTATMVWQQHLTPKAGDPQQQKMMMIMPIVMLFIFYSMPSALVLYWSTSQGLSIVQLLMQRRKSEKSEAADADTARSGTVKLPGKSKGKKK